MVSLLQPVPWLRFDFCIRSPLHALLTCLCFIFVHRGLLPSSTASFPIVSQPLHVADPLHPLFHEPAVTWAPTGPSTASAITEATCLSFSPAALWTSRPQSKDLTAREQVSSTLQEVLRFTRSFTTSASFGAIFCAHASLISSRHLDTSICCSLDATTSATSCGSFWSNSFPLNTCASGLALCCASQHGACRCLRVPPPRVARLCLSFSGTKRIHSPLHPSAGVKEFRSSYFIVGLLLL